MLPSPWASRRALEWSSASRSTISSSATMAAAASTPACRIPPPSELRILRRAVAMKSLLAADDGAHGAGQSLGEAEHERVGGLHQIARSRNALAHGGVEDPCAVHVKCGAAFEWAMDAIVSIYSRVSGWPLQRLWVFSRHTRPAVRGNLGEDGPNGVLHHIGVKRAVLRVGQLPVGNAAKRRTRCRTRRGRCGTGLRR